jgi:Asp-tRNA(Asn)/Glu-tRNA(Gln) amidotransferase A subunit family amidase
MNLPWTHAGLPAVTVPAGTVGGLPVGLQLAARFGADEELLVWAEGLAEALTGIGRIDEANRKRGRG